MRKKKSTQFDRFDRPVPRLSKIIAASMKRDAQKIRREDLAGYRRSMAECLEEAISRFATATAFSTARLKDLMAGRATASYLEIQRICEVKSWSEYFILGVNPELFEDEVVVCCKAVTGILHPSPATLRKFRAIYVELILDL